MLLSPTPKPTKQARAKVSIRWKPRVSWYLGVSLVPRCWVQLTHQVHELALAQCSHTNRLGYLN